MTVSIFILLARVIDRIGVPLSKFKIDDTKLTTMMPYGAMLKIPDAATANEDAKDGHQQQQPLWVIRTLRGSSRSGSSLQEGIQIETHRRLG